MRVEVSPRRVTAVPRQPVKLTITVTNTTDVISGHQLRVLGADPKWVTLTPDRLSLFPGTTGEATVSLTLPEGLPAGTRRVSVQVRELTTPGATSITEVELVVPPQRAVALRIDPRTITAGRHTSFGLVVHNIGNTTVSGPLVGTDEEERIRFGFVPASVELGPGERTLVETRVRARRRLVGNPAVRPFTVRVGDVAEAEKPSELAHATFVQKPVLSRGSLALVGLLASMTVFALVVTYALSGVVSRSAADRDLALQVAQAAHTTSSAGAGSITGTARLLTTGTVVPGVTVAAFSSSDTANPVTSAATDQSGFYRLVQLPPGSYKLRFSGAGFADLWYPQSTAVTDAQAVQLNPGQALSGVDVRLGGLPATLAGKVMAASLTGATATLELPMPGTANSGGAVVQTTAVGSDGSFAFADVPSPSVYDLVVSEPSYATETQPIDLAAGESRSGVDVFLPRGDGLISGHVSGAAGPLAGATLTATYGQTSVQTVSLTQGDVGAFTLRNLPTPTTVTLVASKAGYASQTLNLTLAPAQQLTGVSVTLGGAAGTLSGNVVTLPDQAPAAGVNVTVTNGSLTVQTVTESTGTPGHWSAGGLTVPSTYTVTFRRGDLATQTVSISLDAFGNATAGPGGSGGPAADAVDAAMTPSTAILHGVVSLVGNPPTPVGEATVALSSAGQTYQVTTASVPSSEVGHYEVDALPPGTYTVTVSRPGSRATSTIVTLAAGDNHEYDAVIATPASISGTVTGPNGAISGAQVRLFVVGDYPKTAAATTTTDSSGHYAFTAIDAPQNYVVELDYPTPGTPADSQTVTVQESAQVPVNFTVTAASPSPSPSPSTTTTAGSVQ